MSSVLAPPLPTAAPVPPSPMVDEEAKRRRLNAENEAIAEAKATGRGSTIVAGGMIARQTQYDKARARNAVAADLGL